MGRPPCCDKSNVKRGLWTEEEDAKILAYVSRHGTGNWTAVPKKAGLKRCGKSCRLRWTNYLRPDLKHDNFTPQEEELIIRLHATIGSRWSLIANQLPGRTDNDVKNFWNTKLRKKLFEMGIDPVTHKPFSQILADYGNIGGLPNKTTRFGSLNRDLRNAFMSSSSSSSSKPEQNSSSSSSLFPSILDSNTQMGLISSKLSVKMEPIQEISLNNNNNNNSSSSSSWDLLTQLQAIQLVTAEASNQPNNFFHEGSSSSNSSASSSSNANNSNNLTIMNQISCSNQQPNMIQTPSSPFSWSEFLHEDIFLPNSDQHQQQQQQQQQQEQGKENFQWISSSISESSEIETKNEEIKNGNQIKNQGFDGITNVGGSFDYMGHPQQSTGYYPLMNGTSQVATVIGSSSSSDNSFIEGILDQDNEMLMWEFPNLFDDPI